MQALSHYSYHISSGALLLCDLQGGIYADGAVLTDPVLMSQDERYGPTDLGRDGNVNFCSHHVCGEYCRADWTRPRGTSVAMTYVPVAHTTMRHTGPTAPRGAAFMTGGGGGGDGGGGGGGGGGGLYGIGENDGDDDDEEW